VLYDPRGKIETPYHWSIGITTNNQVEAYALLKGLQIERENNIETMTIVGDSKNTIHHLI
jgi:ribonuclease HI